MTKSIFYFLPLDARRTNDLAILGKIWGFVKYYHPAVQNGQYNWDYELYRVLPKIMKCKNGKDLERQAVPADLRRPHLIYQEAGKMKSCGEVW